MFFFCCLGGAWAKQKKKMPPPKQQKKKTCPRPFRACLFFAVWAGGCVYVFAVWAGGWGGGVLLFGLGACFFLLFGHGACSFFLLFGRGRVFFFCCLGRGRVFFFAVWAGDGSSLTYPSAWLVFKRPNNKRDRTEKKKKNTGSQLP